MTDDKIYITRNGILLKKIQGSAGRYLVFYDENDALNKFTGATSKIDITLVVHHPFDIGGAYGSQFDIIKAISSKSINCADSWE
jgi:hypothetical protein